MRFIELKVGEKFVLNGQNFEKIAPHKPVVRVACVSEQSNRESYSHTVIANARSITYREYAYIVEKHDVQVVSSADFSSPNEETTIPKTPAPFCCTADGNTTHEIEARDLWEAAEKFAKWLEDNFGQKDVHLVAVNGIAFRVLAGTTRTYEVHFVTAQENDERSTP